GDGVGDNAYVPDREFAGATQAVHRRKIRRADAYRGDDLAVLLEQAAQTDQGIDARLGEGRLTRFEYRHHEHRPTQGLARGHAFLDIGRPAVLGELGDDEPGEDVRRGAQPGHDHRYLRGRADAYEDQWRIGVLGDAAQLFDGVELSGEEMVVGD